MRGKIINDTYHKSEKEKSKLRMGGGSWTILMSVIDNPKVKKIVYRTEKKKYSIDKENTGSWDMVFKGEHKRIVSIDKWQIQPI